MPTRTYPQIETQFNQQVKKYITNINKEIDDSESGLLSLPSREGVVSFVMDYVSQSILEENPNFEVVNKCVDFINSNQY